MTRCCGRAIFFACFAFTQRVRVDWTVTTPSVTAAPDGPGEQRQGTPAACAAARSTEVGRGTTGYYMGVQPEQSLVPFAVFR